jgi:phosphate transport system permease protein
MSTTAAQLLAPTSGRRRTTDRVMRAVLALGTVIALVPLVLVIYYLVSKGLPAWNVDFFTTDPTGSFLGDPGGIKSAIIGSIIIVTIATIIAVPIGIAVSVWLTQYGTKTKFALLIRYLIDVMTGVPSIVFGLFVYGALVIGGGSGGGFAGWKGSIAIGLLMLPVVAKSAEVALTLVPDLLRESALALGAPKWRVIFRIVLPTAAGAVLTGALLAIARGAGETAPLLYTAFGSRNTTTDPSQPMNALPLQIFSDIAQPRDVLVQRAWGAALLLVVGILALTLVARFIQRRSKV